MGFTVGEEALFTRGKEVHIHCHGVPHHVWEQYHVTKDPWDLIQELGKSSYIENNSYSKKHKEAL